MTSVERSSDDERDGPIGNDRSGDEVARVAVGGWDPEVQVVSESLHCAGCGYELCGLSSAGLCPECFRSVRESIEFASTEQFREWNRVLRGIGRVLLGIALVPVGVILVYAIAFMNFAATTSSPGTNVAAVILFFGILAGVVLFFVGWWTVLGSDARGQDSLARNATRRHARIALVVLAAAVGLIPIAAIWMSEPWVYGSIALVLFAMMVHCHFTVRHILVLAQRAFNKRLESQARRCRWLVPVLFFPGSFLVLSYFAGLGWMIGFVLYLVVVLDTRLTAKRVLAARPWMRDRNEWNDHFSEEGRAAGSSFTASSASSTSVLSEYERDRSGGMA